MDIPRYNKEAGNKVDKNNNRPNHCNPIRLGICCSFLLTYGFRPQSPILSYGFHWLHNHRDGVLAVRSGVMYNTVSSIMIMILCIMHTDMLAS